MFPADLAVENISWLICQRLDNGEETFRFDGKFIQLVVAINENRRRVDFQVQVISNGNSYYDDFGVIGMLERPANLAKIKVYVSSLLCHHAGGNVLDDGKVVAELIGMQ